VDEKSHKREMSAAVRGDFARLRARGVATTIAAGSTEQEPARDAPEADGREQATRRRLPLLRRRAG
jgi:hypothetical protein